MKPIINWGIPLLFTLLLLNCQGKSQMPNDQEEQLIADKTEAFPPFKATFVCRDLTEDEDMPQFEVALSLNKKLHLIDTIMTCATYGTDQYAQYQIPAEAISACGGWWAGAGDYFYAVVEGNVCTIMQGWQDEQQEDDGFHYEQVRRLVVSAQ